MEKLMDKDAINLFDFLKSVSETKEELYDHPDFQKKYPPFMINRFLASSQDTLFLANIMTQFSHLPNNLQYAFFLKGIDKKRRYFQYAGKAKDKSKQLKNIIEYYQCSAEQGTIYLDILTKEQIKIINKLYSKRISKKRG